MNAPPIRDAAAVIVVRDRCAAPAVLMGQRGAGAAFMPKKFVFPGGAVDSADADVALGAPIREPCATRLAQKSRVTPNALVAAAIRELWEETGQLLGAPKLWRTPPESWQSFAETGLRPDPTGLRFFFRAVTPPGPARRFDARFFLVDADRLSSEPDDFSAASGELSHLRWVPLEQAQSLDLPLITAVVLSTVKAHLHDPAPPEAVPFFCGDSEEQLIDWF